MAEHRQVLKEIVTKEDSPAGHKMTFLSDFGDEWRLDVALERIDVDTTVDEPVLLEIHGEPPEQYPTWDE